MPSRFAADGVLYKCAEQFMMACKARLFRDDITLSAIMETDDPREQKRLGCHVEILTPISRKMKEKHKFPGIPTRNFLKIE